VSLHWPSDWYKTRPDILITEPSHAGIARVTSCAGSNCSVVATAMPSRLISIPCVAISRELPPGISIPTGLWKANLGVRYPYCRMSDAIAMGSPLELRSTTGGDLVSGLVGEGGIQVFI
jgi:hypothetical protein